MKMMVPPALRTRRTSPRIALAICLIAFLALGWRGRLVHHHGPTLAAWATGRAAYRLHPIKRLHEEALARYESLLARQSKTFDEAVDEYRRRYKLDPPPGFDEWYEFARRSGSIIIDDYDAIHDGMAPFLSLGPNRTRQMVASGKGGPDVGDFRIVAGSGFLDEGNWQGGEMVGILGDLSSRLRDFEILMNPLDEPRVVIPSQARGKLAAAAEDVEWTGREHISSFEAATMPCRADGRRHDTLAATEQARGGGIPFVTDRSAAMDVCRNPDFEYSVGFFISPNSFSGTTSPVPVLSQAAPNTFADILYPSVWYWDDRSRDPTDFDVPWEDKFDKLYWAGGMTGMLHHDPQWKVHRAQSQRHRFIELTRQLKPGRRHTYLARKGAGSGGAWTAWTSEDFPAELFETSFTNQKPFSCITNELCAEQAEYYQLRRDGRVDERLAYGYKLIMDLDGNTFSGRFHRFLASGSCVLKQTVFREWHDERLVPWLHYVPVSTGMEDLPEIVRYLLVEEEGRELARVIADKGREAHDRSLMRVDAQVYLFRLFLEYARVYNGDEV